MSADLAPLLLILFPLAMAGGCVVLREAPRATLLAGLATLAVEAALALSAPSMAPARLLDLRVAYDTAGRIVLVAVCAGGFVATLAAAIDEQGASFVATLLLITGCAASVAVTREPLVAGAVLLLGGLAGGVQLADRPAGEARQISPLTLGVALRYTTIVALGGLVLLLGLTILSEPAAFPAGGAVLRLGFGLLLFGYAVRCGLLPFHIWLADTVEHAPPATTALHAGVLAALALPVLVIALDARPELLADNLAGRRLLLGLGAVAALAGGVLGSLADTRRGPAYLASANLGLLTIGLGTFSATGLQAAVLGSAGHVLGIALVALGLALVSAAVAHAGRSDRRVHWAGALVLSTGLLLLVGIPPFAGFAPRLLLLAAAGQAHWLLAAITVAGISLMALTAGRLLSAALRAQPAAVPRDETGPDTPGAPFSVLSSRVLLVLAVLLSLTAALAGFWLVPLTAQLDESVRNLGFVVP